MLSQALTEWCDADCSFINAGVLIDDLPQGTITEYDLHRICPHPINPVTVRLTGSQLKEVLVQTIDDKYTSLELKDLVFAEKFLGKLFMIVSQSKEKEQPSILKLMGKNWM